VQKNPKSAQILALVSKKDLIRHSRIIAEPLLVAAFLSKTTTPSRRIADTLALLTRQGFLSLGLVDGEKVYTITLKGTEKLNRAKAVSKVFDTKAWDGRYYLVTFNIAQPQKVLRNQIILDLKHAGFINYSKGLWLSPYNPIKYVESVRKSHDLGQKIRLIVASHLEDEAKIKRHFKLK